MQYKDDVFLIYFGDAHIAVHKQHDATYNISPLAQLAYFRGKTAILGNQVHGIDGIHVTREHKQILQSFTVDADFLYTNEPSVALGVLTADCVPVVLCDYTHKAYAVVHAGWRGAHAGIVPRALATLQTTYGTQSGDIHVFIGPSARACCYKVDQPFYDTVATNRCARNCFSTRGDQLFFDVSAYVHAQLVSAGVQEKNIHTAYNICTICTLHFCSYRREQNSGARNVTLVSLCASTVLR